MRMDKRQRVAMQRALMREALGKIDAATELFGVEDRAVAGDDADFEEWESRIETFRIWVFEESPIA